MRLRGASFVLCVVCWERIKGGGGVALSEMGWDGMGLV